MCSLFTPEYSTDGRITKIYDNRYDQKVDLTDGRGFFGFYSFTETNKNINNEERGPFSPYKDGIGEFENFKCMASKAEYLSNSGVRAEITFLDNYIDFVYSYNGKEYSEFGAYLPFNFMNRRNGKWQQQFLPSSPFNSKENGYHFCYLTRPDNKNIVLVCLTEIDGFKLDYSEYCCAHFFTGYRVLRNFDKAYKRPLRSGDLHFRIYGVYSYDDALEKVSNALGLPVCCYKMSFVKMGNFSHIKIIGNCDKVEITSPSGQRSEAEPINGALRLMVWEYGDYTVTPYINGKKGIECRVFCFDGYKEMLTRTVKTVVQHRDEVIGKDKSGRSLYNPPYVKYSITPDFNLCEHCMWALAALKYLKYNNDPIIKADIENLLSIILLEDPDLFRQSLTIVPEKQSDIIIEYSTYNSTRIQEAFNGVNILLEAYRYFKCERYLNMAVKILTAHMKNMYARGGIYSGDADYSTVTGMVIPIVDCAVFLEDKDKRKSEFFKSAAVYLADFVLKGGMRFPTETSSNPDTTTEIEEGSMSCSALTLLYVYYHIKHDEKYISYARQVLKYHNAWLTSICFPQCFASTVRWWETIWEGDHNGPAICCGHAWTIWRAEAEFYFALITNDKDSLIRSYNSFFTNISKTDKDGNMYSIYRLESIVAGGYCERADKIYRGDALGYPQEKDSTLSRYVFARAAETIFSTVVLIDGKLLGAEVSDGILIPDWYYVKNIFIDDCIGTFKIKAEKIRIFTKKKYSVKKEKGIITIKVF